MHLELKVEKCEEQEKNQIKPEKIKTVSVEIIAAVHDKDILLLIENYIK